jgi:AraC-like DNA-binding protein
MLDSPFPSACASTVAVRNSLVMRQAYEPSGVSSCRILRHAVVAGGWCCETIFVYTRDMTAIQTPAKTVVLDVPSASRESAIIWSIPEFGGLDLMRARFVRHAFARHAHEEYFVGLIVAGTKTFSCRGADQTVGAGGVSLVNPDEAHTGKRSAGDALEYRALYPSVAVIEQLAREMGFATKPHFTAPVVNDKDLTLKLQHAFETLEHSSDSLERESNLLTVFAHLLEHHSSERLTIDFKPEHRAIGETQAYLESHVNDSLTLCELALVADLSAFHLTRVFKRQLGLSPFEYQTQLRISRAKQLLRNGTPLAQVALEVGYADQANFTKQFKHLTGTTPGRFAQSR